MEGSSKAEMMKVFLSAGGVSSARWTRDRLRESSRVASEKVLLTRREESLLQRPRQRVPSARRKRLVVVSFWEPGVTVVSLL